MAATSQGQAPKRACKRCGVKWATTPSGHLRAHPCPHGRKCVLTYADREKGLKPRRCGPCDRAMMRARQLELFPTTSAEGDADA